MRQVPAAFDWLRPTAGKLRGLVEVTEEKNRWVRGFLASDPSVVLEISFENATTHPTLPTTSVTYMGIWSGRRCLFEFQLGKICVRYDHATGERIVLPLMERLKAYYPPVVSRDDLLRASRHKTA